MSKKVYPTINSVTLSGEIVSAPITRRARGGPKQTTFIIGVTSSSAGPARIAVAAPAEMAAGLSEALKVGVEVLVEGQLIAAPVRTGRGLTPLRISATRIHALGPGGISHEISADAIAVSEETVAPLPVETPAEPKRKAARSRPESARKSRSVSTISVRPVNRTAISPAATETSGTQKAKPTPAVPQHGRQRRRIQVKPEESQSIESTVSVGKAVSSASVSKRPAKTGTKKTGVRPKKTTSRRPSKTSAKRPAPPVGSKTQAQKPKQPSGQSSSKPSKPSVKSKPMAKRATRPSGSSSKSGKTTGPASDSPFALTKSESTFDPFLVDDTE